MGLSFSGRKRGLDSFLGTAEGRAWGLNLGTGKEGKGKFI